MTDQQETSRPGKIHFEVFEDKNTFHWVLFQTNRKPIAASAIAYKRRKDLIAALERIKPLIADAPIYIAQQGAPTDDRKPLDETPPEDDQQGEDNDEGADDAQQNAA